MDINHVNLGPHPMSPLHEMGSVGENGTKSPLMQKFAITWDNWILFSNLALLTAGIAYAFFCGLTELMVGLTFYGIYYCLLTMKAKKVAEQKAIAEVKATQSQAQQDKVRIRQEVDGLRNDRKRINGEIEGLKKQRALAQADLNSLRAKAGR